MATELDRPILERVAAGDSTAVQACLREYGALVWSIARRFSSTTEEAEDATQEIFVEVWKSAARFEESRAPERTFVAMIARRRMIDRLRAAKRRPELVALPDDFEPASDAHEKIETGVEAGLAARALQDLQPEQRRIVLLSVLQGLTHAEIAEETRTPLGTVKSTLRRALLRVRESLEQRAVPPPEVSS